uniref:Uncharacterized protein n=1 Tax=Arundo donax TaxID=35708 RepID=A0A0A8XQV0_ARUDO
MSYIDTIKLILFVNKQIIVYSTGISIIVFNKVMHRTKGTFSSIFLVYISFQTHA